MLVPLICTGIFSLLQRLIFFYINLLVKNIRERHYILTLTIGTRPEEDQSYLRAQVMLLVVGVLFLLGSFVEATAYWLFNFKVLEIAILAAKLFHPFPRFILGTTYLILLIS